MLNEVIKNIKNAFNELFIRINNSGKESFYKLKEVKKDFSEIKNEIENLKGKKMPTNFYIYIGIWIIITILLLSFAFHII